MKFETWFRRSSKRQALAWQRKIKGGSLKYIVDVSDCCELGKLLLSGMPSDHHKHLAEVTIRFLPFDGELFNRYEEEEIEEVNIITGDDAFCLYDTYGFPLELTERKARKKGFVVDREGFRAVTEEKKQES